jgi:hypothetical protein
MTKSKIIIALFLCVACLPAISSSATQSKRQTKDLAKAQAKAPAVIWENPGDVRSRDLYYGPGSRTLQPAPPLNFIEEDLGGTSPKFKVKDARQVEWVVKLGREAQAETAATRLVWAAGYFAEEAYYFPRVRINNLQRLSRGQKYVEEKGMVTGARFEPRRKVVKRGETWTWRKNPFVGTRELDGLRVMMILLNNFDVKTGNNQVLTVFDPRHGRWEDRYVVTDLGASLGRAGGIGEKRSKNDVEDFVESRFIRGVEDGIVDFDYSVGPSGFGWVSVVYPPAFRKQWHKMTAMKDIPAPHAQWVGARLARLTDAQLHDAFRAAAYDQAAANAYVRTMRERISQLDRLRDTQQRFAEARQR